MDRGMCVDTSMLKRRCPCSGSGIFTICHLLPLVQMFGPESPQLEWDTQGQYTRGVWLCCASGSVKGGRNAQTEPQILCYFSTGAVKCALFFVAAGTVELFYLSWAGKPLSSAQLLHTLSSGLWPEQAQLEDHGPSRWVLH